MGAVLPPHLSPFTENRQDQTYIPPEERALMDPDYKLDNCKISILNIYTQMQKLLLNLICISSSGSRFRRRSRK